jgi:hypothetical protein
MFVPLGKNSFGWNKLVKHIETDISDNRLEFQLSLIFWSMCDQVIWVGKFPLWDLPLGALTDPILACVYICFSLIISVCLSWLQCVCLFHGLFLKMRCSVNKETWLHIWMVWFSRQQMYVFSLYICYKIVSKCFFLWVEKVNFWQVLSLSCTVEW